MPDIEYEACVDSGLADNWIVKASWDKTRWEEILELEAELRILKQNSDESKRKQNNPRKNKAKT